MIATPAEKDARVAVLVTQGLQAALLLLPLFYKRMNNLGKIPNKTEPVFPQFPQLYVARKFSIY